ncbi:unnamed protein product [Pleuronectes platessa]|uniref:Uncharacterized protein n=1 Tax=Pleuronectes platessa TaxID=8262 RepID=A0A9N7UT19_PLEPL|nr:unnamed protein product [Pleuronectes platessa]
MSSPGGTIRTPCRIDGGGVSGDAMPPETPERPAVSSGGDKQFKTPRHSLTRPPPPLTRTGNGRRGGEKKEEKRRRGGEEKRRRGGEEERRKKLEWVKPFFSGWLQTFIHLGLRDRNQTAAPRRTSVMKAPLSLSTDVQDNNKVSLNCYYLWNLPNKPSCRSWGIVYSVLGTMLKTVFVRRKEERSVRAGGDVHGSGWSRDVFSFRVLSEDAPGGFR